MLLMDVSFNCWKAGFEGDKVGQVLKVALLQICLTQVLKMTLLQICLFLYVCTSIKIIPKTFLREAIDFLLKKYSKSFSKRPIRL